MRNLRRSDDLEDSEFNTGPTRIKHRRGAKEPPRLRFQPVEKRDWCPDCRKLGLRSEEAAREVIALQVHRGRLEGPGAFALHPYTCPHGWWHIGRNYHTIRCFAAIA